MTMANVDISVTASQASFNKIEALAHSRHHDIDKVAGEFEAMCYANLVKEMFKTTEDSSIWGEGHASEIFRSMFIDVIANAGGSNSLKIKSAVAKSLYNSEENNQTFPERKSEAINVLL